MVEDDLPEEFRGSLDHFNEIADEHVYHMAMMSHAREGFDALSAIVEPKIKVLHTTNSIPFVTCDNPARPYKPKRLNEIVDSFLPGLKDPSVHLLYPVSPLCCIAISSNRSWREFSHQAASPSSVRAMNTALAIMADEEIVFGSPNASVFQRWLRLDSMRGLLRP